MTLFALTVGVTGRFTPTLTAYTGSYFSNNLPDKQTPAGQVSLYGFIPLIQFENSAWFITVRQSLFFDARYLHQGIIKNLTYLYGGGVGYTVLFNNTNNFRIEMDYARYLNPYHAEVVSTIVHYDNPLFGADATFYLPIGYQIYNTQYDYPGVTGFFHLHLGNLLTPALQITLTGGGYYFNKFGSIRSGYLMGANYLFYIPGKKFLLFDSMKLEGYVLKPSQGNSRYYVGISFNWGFIAQDAQSAVEYRASLPIISPLNNIYF